MPPQPGPPSPPGFPIDSGIVVLAIAGILYGCYMKWSVHHTKNKATISY